ncbi:MAG: biotin/lipoate--protein ligase family protein [Pseudomonadota bacterium]
MNVNSPQRSLVLPPPYTAHWLPTGDPFEDAQRRAKDEGAGTLVWHASQGRDGPGRLDFAVVLEPDRPLGEARKAVLVGMVALADAIATHAPPERDIQFDWPTGLLLDGGRLGGMRLAVAPDAQADTPPDWMVLGVELIADRDHLDEAGSYPGSVSLKEEEFTDPPAIVESFAAHLMLNFDRWTHGGFDSIAERYIARLTEPAALGDAGERLLNGEAEPLEDGLAKASWRCAAGPKL